MQQDWYLHEQRTPAPITTITPIGGSLGANFSLCPSGTYTLTINSTFPGIQAGDYLLVRMYIVAAKSGTQQKWMSLPPALTWIDWKPVPALAYINDAGVGAPTVWAGGFVSSAGEAFAFNVPNTQGFCFNIWALRGVSKTQPIDYVYYGFNIFLGNTDDTVNSLSSTASVGLRAGQSVWIAPPNLGGENYLQITEHVLTGPSLSTPSYSFFGAWHGPSANYYLPTYIRQTGPAGSYGSFYVELFADTISNNAFSEVTQTTFPDTLSGGLRTWTKLGTATSATWIGTSPGVSPVYLRAFNAVSGTLTAIQQYQKRVVLNPTQDYVFWVHCGRSTSNGAGNLGMSVTDPLGNEFGASIRSFRISRAFGWYRPFNGGFKKYGSHRTDNDGIPSNVAEVYLGLFEASLTGTYQFSIFTTTNGDETGKSNLGGFWTVAAAGVNPASKSIGLPYFNPVLGIPYGISRVALAENTPTGAAGWSGTPYGKFFSLKPQNVPVAPFYMIGHGSRYLNIAPSLPTQGDTLRQRSYCDDTVQFESNRCLWPRRYETSITSTWTWGRYYAELNVSQVDSTLNFNYGFLVPAGGLDGLTGASTRTGRIRFSGSGVIDNDSGGAITLSSGGLVTLGGIFVLGLEVDFAPSNPSINLSRDGSVFANFRMASTSAGFYSMDQPWKLWLGPEGSGLDREMRTTVQTNFTGPFSHKPAGAVAFDWQNEVP